MNIRTETVMGMPVTVHVPGPPPEPALLDAFFAELRAADTLFSTFKPASAVSRINRGELPADEAGPLVSQVLELCRLYKVTTNGYFDAWAGGRLDPSGLVKSWAVDRAAGLLARAGISNVLVDAGGDVLARGLAPGAEPWQVGIRHPRRPDAVVRVVLASDLAVATSGTYEKGRHIVEPHSLRAADELVSLTVVGPDLLDCDVYATAALAMGCEGIDFVESIAGYEAYAIDHALVARWTSGFDRLCLPRQRAETEIEVARTLPSG